MHVVVFCFLIITARVQSTREGNIFSLSVYMGGGGVSPASGPRSRGYSSLWSSSFGGGGGSIPLSCYWSCSKSCSRSCWGEGIPQLGQDICIPMQTGQGYTPPPPPPPHTHRRASEAMPRVVRLLRSQRKTFLFTGVKTFA